ncbi:hypothetical protein [Streptococcus thoraltensis]|uniref:hypothetical protein n=1 Tax=Streptococcus thoraltensis TaxID=55085 RepID=UPI001F55F45A|nr:hypothetical protein [Streptococcus thoraltensis]
MLEVGETYFLMDTKGKSNQEAQLTKWFYQHHTGVEVIAYINTDRDYLLTRAVTGSAATSFLNQPESVCTILEKHATTASIKPQAFPTRLSS